MLKPSLSEWSVSGNRYPGSCKGRACETLALVGLVSRKITKNTLVRKRSPVMQGGRRGHKA